MDRFVQHKKVNLRVVWEVWYNDTFLMFNNFSSSAALKAFKIWKIVFGSWTRFFVTSNFDTTHKAQFHTFMYTLTFNWKFHSNAKQSRDEVCHFLQLFRYTCESNKPPEPFEKLREKNFSLSLLFVAYQNVTFRFFAFCIGVWLLGRASAGIKSTRGYGVDWQSLYFFSHYGIPLSAVRYLRLSVNADKSGCKSTSKRAEGEVAKIFPKLRQSILIGFGDEAMKVNQTYIISFLLWDPAKWG